MKKLLCILFLVANTGRCYPQAGCTDPQASNYNAAATQNDGSCLYPSTNLNLQFKANLATPVLDESSGVEFVGNSLWTHNDSGNSPTLYRVDSANGSVLQSVAVSNATNVDWEDITSGPDYIYIGDFGNNNGNRTNLKLYRVAKSDLTPAATSVIADVINFSFSDQTSFVSAPNNNNYDCESVIYYHDSLHLFSKDWVDKQCRHYVLPATPGTYVAQVKESFNAGNLITGASIQEGGVIALIGYDKTGIVPISLWMLYDYKDGLFFNGNKRKFNLSSAIVNGQTEAVDFKNGAYGYISNERFQQTPVNIAPTLKAFDLSPYLPASFVNPPPVADFSVNTDSICKGGSISYTDQSVLNPISWNWSFPGGNPSNSILQNPVITYSTPGIYPATLIVSNAGGSVDTLIKSNLISVFNTPSSTISANGPTNFCTGGSVLLSGNQTAGLSYQWKKNGVNIAGANASVYSAFASGSYKVITTNPEGCSKSSNTITVTGPPNANITANGPLSFCSGDSVVFTSSAGNGYSWQWKRNGSVINGASAINYSAKTAGIYKVIVSNLFGCSKASNSKTVTVNCKTTDSLISDLFIVYPNPAQDNLTVQSGDEIRGLYVVDICGRIILNFQNEKSDLSCSRNIDIGDIKPGTYFIHITSGKSTHVKCFTKY